MAAWHGLGDMSHLTAAAIGGTLSGEHSNPADETETAAAAVEIIPAGVVLYTTDDMLETDTPKRGKPIRTRSVKCECCGVIFHTKTPKIKECDKCLLRDLTAIMNRVFRM